MGAFLVYPRLSGSGTPTPGQTSTTTYSQSSTDSSSTGSSGGGGPFVFAPPKLSGGDAPVTTSDIVPHSSNLDWVEAKMISSPGGQVWYIHANLIGGTVSTSGSEVSVTTHSDPSTYPQGVFSFDSQTDLYTFKVTSVPAGSGNGNGWFRNAKAGDVIECYPFSSKAVWAWSSYFFAVGNCKVNGGPLGVGDFDRLWAAGALGVNGAPLPSCYPASNFEASGSIVTESAVIVLHDVACPGLPRYQEGGVLWFDTGQFEDVGTVYGKAPIVENATSPCGGMTLTIPTSRGEISGFVAFSPFNTFGSNACKGEDSTLSGSLSLAGTSSKVVGVVTEFRCVELGTYC